MIFSRLTQKMRINRRASLAENVSIPQYDKQMLELELKKAFIFNIQ